MFDYFEDDLAQFLEQTKNQWEKVRNKTVFVTGGTGFFGIWFQMTFLFVNQKLDLNAKMIILTRDKSKFLLKYPWLSGFDSVSFLEGNVSNFQFIDEPIDFIIHAATEASVKLNLEEPMAMFDTVVNGTKRILDFAKQKRVSSFLFTSSGAVYGKQPSELINMPEEYIGAPITSDAAAVYGEGKRMAEVLCAVYFKHSQLPVKIARCYAFVGPFLPLDSHFAAGNFIKNVLDEQDIVIQGDGTPYRSYMYPSDLMTWLWTILLSGKDNRPYNVGSDYSLSISDLATLVADTSGFSSRVIVQTPRSETPPLRYVPNVNRAKDELNLKISVDLETSIYKTVNFNKTFLTK